MNLPETLSELEAIAFRKGFELARETALAVLQNPKIKDFPEAASEIASMPSGGFWTVHYKNGKHEVVLSTRGYMHSEDVARDVARVLMANRIKVSK